MRSLVLLMIAAFATGLTGPALAQAESYQQTYLREDGIVLLQKRLDGRIVARPNTSWDKRRKPDGTVYFQCRYEAHDSNGRLVNSQLLYYFPNAPQADNSELSNHWVYWYNPKTDVIWGRCPTAKHPQYARWVAAKGVDLWQVIPPADRPALKGERSVTKIFGARNLGIVGVGDTSMPKVEAKPQAEPVQCVDLKNTIFI
jgi:hypothetical protein